MNCHDRHPDHAVIDVDGVWWNPDTKRVTISLRKFNGRSQEFEVSLGSDITNQTPGLVWINDPYCDLDAGHIASELRTLIEDELSRHADLPTPIPNDIDHYEFTFDDEGNARRLLGRWGRYFRYVAESARKPYPFAYYTGQQWAFDKCGVVNEWAHEMVDHFALWVEALPNGEDRDEESLFKKAARANLGRLRSTTGYTAMLSMVKTFADVVVNLDQFDREPYYVNVLNGVIDLRTGEHRPHDPDLLLRRMAPVDFVPSATCPKWEEQLRRPFDDDDEAIRCFQRYVGQALYGRVEEKGLVIFYGESNTGKSVISNNLQWLFGEYANSTSWETFAAKKGHGIPNDLAKLAGVRLVLVSELPQEMTLAMDILKRWTGGDKIEGRFLYSEFFEYEAAGTLLLTTNQLPRITEMNDAAWNRILPLETTNPVPKNDQRSFGAMQQQFRSEASGVLNWLIAGYRDWRDLSSVDPTGRFTKEREEYRAEEDVHGQLLLELTEDGEPEDFITSQALWHAWDAAQLASGISRFDEFYLTKNALGRLLTQRWGKKQRRTVKINGKLVSVYYGKRLRPGVGAPIVDLV